MRLFFFFETHVLGSFSLLVSFDGSELRQGQVGEVGPGRTGNVLTNLVNAHAGGPGTGGEVGSSHLPGGCSGRSWSEVRGMPGVLEEGRGARLVMVWFSFLMLLQLLAWLEAGRSFEVLWPLTVPL